MMYEGKMNVKRVKDDIHNYEDIVSKHEWIIKDILVIDSQDCLGARWGNESSYTLRICTKTIFNSIAILHLHILIICTALMRHNSFNSPILPLKNPKNHEERNSVLCLIEYMEQWRTSNQAINNKHF